MLPVALLLCVLCVLCGKTFAQTPATVYMPWKSATSIPAANRRVLLSPASWTINGTNYTSSDQQWFTNDANGLTTFSNLFTGAYTATLQGPYTTTAVIFVLTNGSGTYNATQLPNSFTNLAAGAAWTAAQADARYPSIPGAGISYITNNGQITESASGLASTNLASANANGLQSSNQFNTVAAATNVNNPGTLVQRDGSGNFSAGTITAALAGNATTATTAGGAPPTGAAGGVLSGTYPAPGFAASPTFTGTTTVAAETNTGTLGVAGAVNATNPANKFAGAFTGNGGALTNVAYSNLVNRLLFANLRDFGAKGDGATDDSAAVQAWSTYGTANNLNLYAPAGNYKLTTTIFYNSPAQNFGYQFVSWKIFGDGPNQTQLLQVATNAHIMSFTNGVAGLDLENISFKGAFDGTHPIASIGLNVPVGVGNNNELIVNCSFWNLNYGAFVYFEDVKFDTCTFQDNVIGLRFPNTGAGNNNDNVINCQFPGGALGSAIAASTNRTVGCWIDSGAGHVISGSTFVGYNSNSCGIKTGGCGLVLLGDYVECSGCGEFLNATNGFGHIDMIACSGITGGADGNTNHYAVEIGGGTSLTTSAGNYLSGWSSKNNYKLNQANYTFIDFCGFNNGYYVDEYNSGTFQNTHLITPNPLLIANSTSTNSISPSSQTMTVNGVNVFTIDAAGDTTGQEFVPTGLNGNGPYYGFYTGNQNLAMVGGSGGGGVNNQNNSVNLWKWDNSGNFTIQNGLFTASHGATITGTLTITTSKISSGTGSPNSVVTGSVGDQFLRTDGGASTTLYIKESGTATTTGWVAK